MSDLSTIFTKGCKVVISPDKMRAWISLVKPPRGVQYTAAAVMEWLPQNGVVFGASQDKILDAIDCEKYDDLLEVATGKAPVPASGGDYSLRVEKRPFTGLRALGDGSLIYEDLSFLQEVEEGQVLAELVPATPAENGMTVSGEAVPPREGSQGRQLLGSGFKVSEDGRFYTAPCLAHVNIVNEQLIVTPLAKLESLSQEDGNFNFDGNVLVSGNVSQNASIEATGSVFVVGWAVSANIKSGNNVLLCAGMRSQGGFANIEAKGHVWGLFFDSTNIKAGGDVCANHLMGCEVEAGGRASILGGRGLVATTHLFAQNGVVAGHLGDNRGETVVSAGVSKEFIENYNSVCIKADKLGLDIQSLQQSINTHERINKMRADKGKNDPAYKEMLKRRDQSLSVAAILDAERLRMKRTLDQSSNVAIIARDVANAGITITIDNRSLKLAAARPRTKFSRSQEEIVAVSAQGR